MTVEEIAIKLEFLIREMDAFKKDVWREVQALKQDMRLTMEEVDEIDKAHGLTMQKLDSIQSLMVEIKTSVSKDSGWRGFFLDFIKAVAQIAVLVGAGKWIF